jgi:hypothetical protein
VLALKFRTAPVVTFTTAPVSIVIVEDDTLILVPRKTLVLTGGIIYIIKYIIIRKNIKYFYCKRIFSIPKIRSTNIVIYLSHYENNIQTQFCLAQKLANICNYF